MNTKVYALLKAIEYNYRLNKAYLDMPYSLSVLDCCIFLKKKGFIKSYKCCDITHVVGKEGVKKKKFIRVILNYILLLEKRINKLIPQVLYFNVDFETAVLQSIDNRKVAQKPYRYFKINDNFKRNNKYVVTSLQLQKEQKMGVE